jgi:protein SCO1/2
MGLSRVRTVCIVGLLTPSLLAMDLLAAAPAVNMFADGKVKGILIDQFGHEMPASKLNGHYLLVYFGYTSCPDVCPTALTTMARTLDLLGPQTQGLLPLFVTVDPARDTVAVMRSYVGHFDRRLIGLTGSPGAVAAARQAFDVTARQGRPDDNGNYAFDHSLFVYFAGPDGKVLRTFHASQTAASIASDLRKLLPAAGTSIGPGS